MFCIVYRKGKVSNPSWVGWRHGKVPLVKAKDDKFLFPLGVLSCRSPFGSGSKKLRDEEKERKKHQNLTLSGNFIVLKIDSYFICASRFFSVGENFFSKFVQDCVLLSAVCPPGEGSG